MQKGKEIEKVQEVRAIHHTLNTIAGGFAGGGETISSCKNYAQVVMHISETIVHEAEQDLDPVGFSKRDTMGIMPHEDDPMLIKIQIQYWTFKRVLVDLGSSVDILYLEAFRGMEFNIVELLPFRGTLVGFVGEHVQILGHFPILTTFGSGENAKTIKFRYMVVNSTSPYNAVT